MTFLSHLLKPTTERLFWGLELPPYVQEHLRYTQDRLRAQLPDLDVTWASQGEFHVTVKFLGATRERRAAIAACKLALDCLDPPRLVLQGLGTFQGRSTVLWAGFDRATTDRLQRFRLAIERAHVDAGFKAEARFNPHVTLGRLSRDAVCDPHALEAAFAGVDAPTTQCQASHLTLFKTARGFRPLMRLKIGR